MVRVGVPLGGHVQVARRLHTEAEANRAISAIEEVEEEAM